MRSVIGADAIDDALVDRFPQRLAVAGINRAAAAGATEAMLYVDSDNARAVAMYRSLGFATHHTEHAFVGDVPPA